jgi:site-specific DNA-methyltransferase (adenine-specific)
MNRYQLHHGDNRAVLKTMPDNSVDSIVCDPPYELGFMGKRWDASGIAYDTTLWAECLRVLKPGGHLIAFGGTRTYHRMTVAIEDAGFEIRDSVIWMYGSGFPKSLDVSKAIDKQAGAEREVVGRGKKDGGASNGRKSTSVGYVCETNEYDITAPATPEAQQWHGYGTALKPAHEPAVLARKPLTGTVADNVLTWGVGALNIDGSRVEAHDGDYNHSGNDNHTPDHQLYSGYKHEGKQYPPHALGRWPANVILDEHAAEALDAQSGHSVSKATPRHNGEFKSFSKGKDCAHTTHGHTDSGGASRFFYIAKASRAEREAGLEGMEMRKVESDFRQGGMANPRDTGNYAHRANHHPTVKPIALMRHLVRLVTPKGGTVLDPFMGSGSTGCAAMLEGMRFVGIDITAEYVDIAERRIQYWMNQNPMEL